MNWNFLNTVNDSLTYFLYFMTFILALLTGFVKFKTENNKLNNSGIYYISFLVLFLVASVAMTCNQAKIRDINIASSEKNRLNDSIESLNRFLKSKEKADSIQLNSIKTLDSVISSLHEIRELQEVSSIIEASTQNTLKTQGSLLLSNDSLLKNQMENYNQITGGDTYGFIHFIELPDINSQDIMKHEPIKRKFHFGLLNKGIFPLYDNSITISEPIKWILYNNRDYNYFKVDRLNPPHKTSNSSIWWLDNRSILDDETIIMFEISIYSRNDEFNQTTIFKKIKRPISNFERWTEATRVSSLNKKKYIYEFIDPEFPKDSLGKVEWELYKAVEYYHKTKK